MAQIAYAETVSSAIGSSAPGSASPVSAASPFMSMVPLLFIFVIFYFLLIRPQQKKVKEHKKLLEALKSGDLIITSSGFYAHVVSVGDTTVEVRLADNVKAKILKSSVSEVVTSGESQPA